MIKKAISVFFAIICISGLLMMSSCDRQKNEFKEYFTEFYTYFNDSEFEKYVDYFIRYEDEKKAEMLSNLNGSAEFYKNYYIIDKLSYETVSDGRTLVTVDVIDKCVFYKDTITKEVYENKLIRYAKKNYQYIMSYENGNWIIDDYRIMSSEAIDEKTAEKYNFGKY